MDVAAVTILRSVTSSSWAMSSRYAAVKAPEVMTLISHDIVLFVVLYSSVVTAWSRSLRLRCGQLQPIVNNSMPDPVTPLARLLHP